MYSLYNTTEPAPKGHFSHDIHCYFKFILALVDSLINNNNFTSLFTFKSKITMFWSRNPLDLTVDWETNDRLFSCRRKHWTPCSVCPPAPLTHLRQLLVYQPDVFFSLFLSSTGHWRRRCIRFKTKRKYLTRITARATSLYKLHDDLRRQTGLLSEDIRCSLHLSRGDVSDDKLKAPAALPSSSCPRGFVNNNFPPYFVHLYVSRGPHCAAASSNEPITFLFFFLLQGTMLDLLRALWVPKGKTTQRRVLIYTEAKNRQSRIFFALSCLPHKVHSPSGSYFISLKVLYVRILV